MYLPKLLFGVGLTGLLVTGAVAPASAATTGTFTSTIYSAATRSCPDVPGGTTDINTDLVGRTCSGAAEQRFTFTPVNGRPHTYTLVNAASRECAQPYRFSLRQRSCSFPATDPTWDQWVLLPVNTAAHQYRLEPASYAAGGSVRVVAAHPAPAGSSSRLLTLDYLNSADPAQTFVLAGATSPRHATLATWGGPPFSGQSHRTHPIRA